MKKLMIMALVLLLAFSCVACSGNAPVASTEPAAGGAAEGATDKLVIWSYMNEGEPISIWQQSVVDAYKEAYPDVDVEIVFCGREIITQFQSKLNDKDAADFPDLISQKDGTLAPLALDGLLVPLDDYFANEKAYDQDVAWGDTFVKQLMECMSIEGKNFFVPEGLYTHGFFYDANQFKALGIEVPKTWDEFTAVCEKLKANGIAPIALDGTEDDYNDWYYCRFAERLVGADTLCDAAAGKITFASNPGFLKAAEYIQNIVDSGYFQDGAAGSIFPSAQALFVQGKAGMFFCGAWIPTEMESQTPDTMDMKMFALPVLPDSASETHEEMWANCFALTSDAKNKENAINFLKIFSSMGVQQSKCDLKNPSPLVGGPAVAELDTIESIVSNASSTSTIYGGTATYSEWYTNIFGPTCTKLITGGLSAEEFIAELDTLTTNFYAG